MILRSAPRVLLVEDNDWDARVAAEAFAASPRPPAEIHRVADGEEALEFLRHAGAHADAPAIDMVLLDLNLPRKDGREVLAEMKADPALRRVPVIVLTTSNATSDILRSYDLHANAYLRKPSDPDEYPVIVEAIHQFWFAWVTFPREAGG